MGSRYGIRTPYSEQQRNLMAGAIAACYRAPETAEISNDPVKLHQSDADWEFGDLLTLTLI